MPQWIAGVTRGHNGSVCLLKDGEIVFAIEEERLSRQKYDGGPYAAMVEILKYTDKLDFLVIAHTQPLKETAGHVDFTGDDIYTGLARKLGLIDRHSYGQDQHPQVIDLSHIHHKLHAACAFYRSGFDEAVAVIVDGAGTFIPLTINNQREMTWELESIFKCNYPANFQTLYKHLGGRGPWISGRIPNMSAEREGESGTYELCLDDAAGITKAYEAVTQYCGFSPIEAGKTMGLFPYGKPNDKIPQIYTDGGPGGLWRSADRNVIIPNYPNGAFLNDGRFEELLTPPEVFENRQDVTLLQNRRDAAYAIQTQSQQEALHVIKKAVEMSGCKNVVFSGGYGLNCVANYYYLSELNKDGINFYVEPISNDAGTAIGAALLWHQQLTQDATVKPYAESLYLGLDHVYTDNDILETTEKYNALVEDATMSDVVNLLTRKNIVTIFQGKSEAGPRALGNRSIMFDPSAKDGKDFVNRVKRREYFRPFAGSILHEHAHEWFDMRGMEQSPHMMYAMNCQPGIAEKIPSIIHVDGTCRIQTVKREQNPHYYDLISEFYNQTGIPIIFNTSFNLGGEPLVETLDDAVRTLANSEIEYLWLPEYGKLITIKN